MPCDPLRAAIGPVLALALISCGGAGGPAPAASPITASTRINDCMKVHGMSAAHDIVAPAGPTARGESLTTFRSCEWPPPAYARPTSGDEGYTEVRVTRVPWPARAEVTNASAPDRIESPCAEVELQYSFGKQAPPSAQTPMRFTAGTITTIGGQPFTEPLPFAASAHDVVVVHNLSYSILSARCLR